MKLVKNRVIEFGYCVDDLEASIRYWIEKMKAGPFFVVDSFPVTDVRSGHEGETADLTLALGSCGGAVIELIKQTNDLSSPWSGSVRSIAGTFNHWSLFTDSFDEDRSRLERRGCPTAFLSIVGGGPSASGPRFAYFDSRHENNAYLELIEAAPSTLWDMYQMVKSAGEDWDGQQDPIRRF